MADLLPRPFGNPFGGIIGNEVSYMGRALSQGRIPYFAPNSTLQPKQTAQQTGMYGRYVPGAQQTPFQKPVGDTPVERAFASEASSVAQQAAQNPEFKRYEDARLKAVAPGATPQAVQSAEDIGMQIWAKANPTLAAKVKPGQSGYDVIQGTLAGGAARQGFGYGLDQQLVPTPQGFPSLPLPMGSVAPGGYAQGFNVQQNLAPNATLTASSAPTATQANLGGAFGSKGFLDDETIKRFQSLIKPAS